MSKRKRISAPIDPATHAWLREQSGRRGVPVAELVRRAVGMYIDNVALGVTPRRPRRSRSPRAIVDDLSLN